MSLDTFLKSAFCWVAIIAIVLVSAFFSIVCLVAAPKLFCFYLLFSYVVRHMRAV